MAGCLHVYETSAVSIVLLLYLFTFLQACMPDSEEPKKLAATLRNISQLQQATGGNKVSSPVPEEGIAV